MKDTKRRGLTIRHKMQTHCPQCNSKMKGYVDELNAVGISGLYMFYCPICEKNVVIGKSSIKMYDTGPLPETFRSAHKRTVKERGIGA